MFIRDALIRPYMIRAEAFEAISRFVPVYSTSSQPSVFSLLLFLGYVWVLLLDLNNVSGDGSTVPHAKLQGYLWTTNFESMLTMTDF